MDRGIRLELDPQVVMSAEDRRRDRIRSATVATDQCRVACISIANLYQKKQTNLYKHPNIINERNEYLNKVEDAINRSFNVKSKEIHLYGFPRIQTDDVDALLTARIRCWIIGGLNHSRSFRKSSSTNWRKQIKIMTPFLIIIFLS